MVVLSVREQIIVGHEEEEEETTLDDKPQKQPGPGASP